jgi:hypothetical protein
MGSLVFAASIVAIVMLIYWVIKNDERVKNGEKSTGIFAMKEHERESDIDK